MLIEQIINLSHVVGKLGSIFNGRRLQFGSEFRSLSDAANQSTYYFPIVASEQLSPEEITMMMRAFERNYAMFTRTAYTLIPAIHTDELNGSSIKDYLAKFHTNIGIGTNPYSKVQLTLESTGSKINYGILNEGNRFTDAVNDAKEFVDDHVSTKQNLQFSDRVTNNRMNNNVGSMGKLNSGHVAMDVDWKKANDMLPTIVNVPVRISTAKDSYVVELSVNIKATMHKAPSKNIISDIVRSMTNGRGFLNFVKYISGEQSSLTDFLFGISNIKESLLSKQSNTWLEAFKRRKRLAQIAWGSVNDNYKPIGTICITMNEVSILKNQYNIDIFKEVDEIMDKYYLLGFAILDQVNEVVHVKFDAMPDFQEYPYKTLEREGNNQDRTLREMIRAMGSVR